MAKGNRDEKGRGGGRRSVDLPQGKVDLYAPGVAMM